jgi:hypothetical protein
VINNIAPNIKASTEKLLHEGLKWVFLEKPRSMESSPSGGCLKIKLKRKNVKELLNKQLVRNDY